MKRFFKFIMVIMAAVIMAVGFGGCRQSRRVNYNVKREADYFNVARRIVVINARTDKPMFELTGYFSLSNSDTNELEITCEIGEGKYQVHYVYLNEWTLYVVEDLSGANVSKYHYEIWYLPETILPSIKPID